MIVYAFLIQIFFFFKSFFLQAEDEEKLHEWISVIQIFFGYYLIILKQKVIQNATTSLLNAQTLSNIVFKFVLS